MTIDPSSFGTYHYGLALELQRALTTAGNLIKYKSSNNPILRSVRIVSSDANHTTLVITTWGYHKELYDFRRQGKYAGTPAKPGHHEMKKKKVKIAPHGAIFKWRDNYKKDEKGNYIKKEQEVYVKPKPYVSWVAKTIKQVTRMYAKQVRAEVNE